VDAESKTQAIARAVFDELACTEWRVEPVELGPRASSLESSEIMSGRSSRGFDDRPRERALVHLRQGHTRPPALHHHAAGDVDAPADR